MSNYVVWFGTKITKKGLTIKSSKIGLEGISGMIEGAHLFEDGTIASIVVFNQSELMIALLESIASSQNVEFHYRKEDMVQKWLDKSISNEWE